MKRSELKQIIREVIEESKALDSKDGAVKLFGKKIDIFPKREEPGKFNLIIDGVKFYSDSRSGGFKKGKEPFSASSGAFYSSGTFDDQLQGKVYTAMATALANGVKDGLSEAEIRAKFNKAIAVFSSGDTARITDFARYTGLKI